MNLDNVDCLTRSPCSPPFNPEDKDNFESPLKNERIMRLSESNGSTGNINSSHLVNNIRKRKSKAESTTD
jgi:hypothetical protein